MIPTIASVTLGGPLETRFAAAAAAGFSGIELFDQDLGDWLDTPEDVHRLIRAHGLEAADFFPLRDCEGMPPDLRDQTLQRAARYLDTACALGAGMVMACANVHPEALPDPDRIAADLHALGEMAAERGLRIAYEALSWGRHVSDYRVAWDLVQRAGHDRVGLVLDSFHILARNHDPDAIRTIPAEKIFLVQISDAPRLEIDFMSWSRGYRTLPGEGAFRFEAFMAALKATGYDGVFSLECFSDTLRARPADEVARAGREALTRLWERGA